MPKNDAPLLKGRPKLAEERLRHHWSQRELADQIGTTFVSVSRWERGITEPGMYYRQQLAALFGKSGEELDLLMLLQKVGGGYIFIHRLLLDYFASQEIELEVDGQAAVSQQRLTR